MFTGIIYHTQGYSYDDQVITFNACDFWNDVTIGESIAVNGVCLTVVTNTFRDVTFFVANETLSKTNLGSDGFANIERSFKFGERNSGHYVSGHVHCTAGIREIIVYPSGERDLWFNCDTTKLVYKDSIAINGVSLTIARIDSNGFMVCMIPHTWKTTTFSKSKEGDTVNIEFNTTSVRLTDDDHMLNALEVSKQATWWDTIPNPRVGCVITNNNIVVATGCHKKHGSLHAEVEALEVLSGDLKDCTMYVTLEPCPMCASALAWAKIDRIVIAASDEKKGFSLLDEKLLHPKTIINKGILEKESKALLQHFFSSKRRK